MLEFLLGFVICELYVYLYACCMFVCCVFICVCVSLYEFLRWDSYASHLMVIIGDRHV